VKKGRHRRYEEARALKQNQDLDLDSIFDSLEIGDREADGDSTDFDKWADENEDGADEALEESSETA
tara:strand:+ start:169 stop:369 length:201 start_codon:yes stop_codon:yes gene_type:complete